MVVLGNDLSRSLPSTVRGRHIIHGRCMVRWAHTAAPRPVVAKRQSPVLIRRGCNQPQVPQQRLGCTPITPALPHEGALAQSSSPLRLLQDCAKLDHRESLEAPAGARHECTPVTLNCTGLMRLMALPRPVQHEAPLYTRHIDHEAMSPQTDKTAWGH